jgi:hypothetical protein
MLSCFLYAFYLTVSLDKLFRFLSWNDETVEKMEKNELISFCFIWKCKPLCHFTETFCHFTDRQKVKKINWREIVSKAFFLLFNAENFSTLRSSGRIRLTSTQEMEGL